MNVLIPRNSKNPGCIQRGFHDLCRWPDFSGYPRLPGERELVADNRTLGSFDLTGIDPQQAGMPRIEVSFMLDARWHLR